MKRQGFQGRINRHAVHGSNSTESEHQQALFSWLTETEALQPDETKREALHWCHAIPNQAGRAKPFIDRRGRRLPPLEAIRLKAEGVKAGICDIRLDYVSRASMRLGDQYPALMGSDYLGLIAEMKSGKNKLTPEQKRYQQYMESQGFLCKTWYTWQRAARDIILYMSLSEIASVFVEIEKDEIMHINRPEFLLRMPQFGALE